MSEWKTILSIALTVGIAKGKLKQAEVDALRDLMDSGSVDDVLVKVLELWIAHELTDRPPTSSSEGRLDEIEADIAELYRRVGVIDNALAARPAEPPPSVPDEARIVEILQRLDAIEEWINDPKRPRPRRLGEGG